MTTFSIDFTSSDNTFAISLSGDVDLLVGDKVWTTALTRLESSNLHDVVVDLGGVTFIDSVGIGALIKIRNAAQQTGRTFALRTVPEQAAKVLSLTGLDAILTTLPAATD
jgi:anti-anti-sigma factor